MAHTTRRVPHTIVVGGGIAGLSVAWHLARDGRRRVTLLEHELLLATHSSARNAQIWLPVDPDDGALARRSAELLTGLLGHEHGWLSRCGAVVLAATAQGARSLGEGARLAGLAAHPMTRASLAEHAPAIEREDCGVPLFVEGAGVFDPHAMLTALTRACRDAGVTIRTRAHATELIVQGGAVRGVRLRGAREPLDADEVVDAAGAWAGRLGAAVGAPVPLVPLRRHLVLLAAPPRGTTVWRFGAPEVYWRPESGGLLASPCDETPHAPGLPPVAPEALELLTRALAPLAPSLLDAPIRTQWACLRTYAHDRQLVLGPDPRLRGLAWVAGFGGRGMTVAVAAAERCAHALLDDTTLPAELRPERAQPSALLPAFAA